MLIFDASNHKIGKLLSGLRSVGIPTSGCGMMLLHEVGVSQLGELTLLDIFFVNAKNLFIALLRSLRPELSSLGENGSLVIGLRVTVQVISFHQMLVLISRRHLDVEVLVDASNVRDSPKSNSDLLLGLLL